MWVYIYIHYIFKKNLRVLIKNLKFLYRRDSINRPPTPDVVEDQIEDKQQLSLQEIINIKV